MKKSITLNMLETIYLRQTIASAIEKEDNWYEYFRKKGLTYLAQDSFNNVQTLRKLLDLMTDTIQQPRKRVMLSQEELP